MSDSALSAELGKRGGSSTNPDDQLIPYKSIELKPLMNFEVRGIHPGATTPPPILEYRVPLIDVSDKETAIVI